MDYHLVNCKISASKFNASPGSFEYKIRESVKENIPPMHRFAVNGKLKTCKSEAEYALYVTFEVERIIDNNGQYLLW